MSNAFKYSKSRETQYKLKAKVQHYHTLCEKVSVVIHFENNEGNGVTNRRVRILYLHILVKKKYETKLLG